MSTPNDSGTENGNDSGSEFEVNRLWVFCLVNANFLERSEFPKGKKKNVSPQSVYPLIRKLLCEFVFLNKFFWQGRLKENLADSFSLFSAKMNQKTRQMKVRFSAPKKEETYFFSRFLAHGRTRVAVEWPSNKIMSPRSAQQSLLTLLCRQKTLSRWKVGCEALPTSQCKTLPKSVSGDVPLFRWFEPWSIHYV